MAGSDVYLVVMRLLSLILIGLFPVAVCLATTITAFGQTTPCPPNTTCDFRKFDEIPFPGSDVMARLDNVAIAFQRESSDIVLYLIAYAGPHACVGDADRLNLRAKTYLVAKRGVDSRRVILIDGGYLEQSMIDVWILPSHLSPPDAVPNIDRNRIRVRNCSKHTSARRRRA
jgi:hypothetical protein